MSDNSSQFIDTNILLYLLYSDEKKANRSEEIIAAGGVISVQVLNEFVNVARKRLDMPWSEIRVFLTEIRVLLSVVDLNIAVHEFGCELAERYKLSVYDAFIVSAAINSGCTNLFSEDMQHKQQFDNKLTVVNPYKSH